MPTSFESSFYVHLCFYDFSRCQQVLLERFVIETWKNLLQILIALYYLKLK